MANGLFVCAWTYGDGSKTVYYHETPDGHWGTTFNRSEAKQFASSKQATDAWLSKHRFPEDYEHCIAEGLVRAERVDQPELLLALQEEEA